MFPLLFENQMGYIVEKQNYEEEVTTDEEMRANSGERRGEREERREGGERG